MLIDTHAHLNDEKLKTSASEIIANMGKDNLLRIINVGYDRKSSEDAYVLAKNNEKIYSAVGIHPHDSSNATDDDYNRFAELYKEEKVVAIGEVGLDYYYDLSPRDEQKRVFCEQIELAYSLNAPMIIHLRDAYGDMYKLLNENKSKLGKILIHCYSGSKEMLNEFNKLDAYYSYGGAITFKNATEKPEIVRNTPIDRILTETDCPYMSPVPYRGQTNQPKNVNIVAEKVAEILGKTKSEIEEITTKNAFEFFDKLL